MSILDALKWFAVGASILALGLVGLYLVILFALSYPAIFGVAIGIITFVVCAFLIGSIVKVIYE